MSAEIHNGKIMSSSKDAPTHPAPAHTHTNLAFTCVYSILITGIMNRTLLSFNQTDGKREKMLSNVYGAHCHVQLMLFLIKKKKKNLICTLPWHKQSDDEKISSSHVIITYTHQVCVTRLFIDFFVLLCFVILHTNIQYIYMKYITSLAFLWMYFSYWTLKGVC